MTTDSQPTTAAHALRWAAGCTNCLDDSELLTAMAAELDAAPATRGSVREAARWLLDAVVAFVLEPDDDDTDEVHDARYRAMCSAADDLRVALDAAPAADPGVNLPDGITLDMVRWHCTRCEMRGTWTQDPNDPLEQAVAEAWGHHGNHEQWAAERLSTTPPAGTEGG